MNKLQSLGLLTVIIVAGLAATGCPEHRSISEIERNPGRYENKEVIVTGRVVDSYGLGIPGTKYGGGAYKIDDGTGSVWVIVSDGNVPSRGAEVGVKGRLSSGVNWKGRNYGLAIYENDRRYGKR
nr:nucleic aci-binding, OB-fold tRNA/helicase-type protein [uncultured bacterium]